MSKTEYSRFNFIYSLLLILFIASSVFGEGTKELTPKGGETATRVQVGTDRVSNFATYTSTPDKRMYIHIEDFNNEKIFLGFGKYYDNDYNEKPLYYRLKDPAGNIVIPGQRVPVKDSGHIKTHKEAVIGPLGLNGSVGGYTPIEFKPSMNGDYYIEFSTDNTEIDNENPSNRRVFEYFDITVGGSDFNKLPGRLWAYTWSLYSCGMSVNSYAKFFIYTKDSVVTRLDLNGMRPCGFGVLANQNGTTSSSVFAESRKSTSKNTSYPEYKIFLNDPDNISYPSFTTDVKLNDSLQLKGCFNSGYCIRVNTTKDATGEILIDFNGNRKLDGNDRLLILDLKAGDTCIPWDGMDAQGKLIASGFKGGKIYLKLYKGLTNFPIYDPENNDDGIKVDVWRDPAFADGKPTKVFWDDSNIPKLPASPPVKNLEGCLYTNSLTGGCHVWNKVEPEDFNGAGNENTMNTWWYVFEYNDSTNIVIDAPPLVDAGKDVVVCNKAQTIDIGSLTSTKEKGATYLWTELPVIETTLIDKDSIRAKATGFATATKSKIDYLLTATKNGCSVSDTMQVTFTSVGKPKIFGKSTVCPESKDVQYWVVDSNAVTKDWSVLGNPTIAINPPASGDTIKVVDFSNSVGPIVNLKVVTTYLNGCPKDSAIFPVEITQTIVTPKPFGDSIFCPGTPVTVNYIVPNSQNSTFKWFKDGNINPELETSNQITVTWDHNVLNHKIGVIETVTNSAANTCIGKLVELPIVIKTKPILLSTKDTSTCSGIAINLGSVIKAQPAGSTYQWISEGHLSNGRLANPSFVYSSAIQDTIKYILQVRQNGCTTRDSLNVVVKPNARIKKVSGIQACEDSLVTYSIIDTLATTREWFVYNADTLTTKYTFTKDGNNEDSIKVQWGKKTTNAIVKVVSKGECAPDSAIITVLVKTYEQYKPKGDSGICFDKPITLPYTVRSNGGGKYKWNLIPTPLNIGKIVSRDDIDTIQIEWSGIGSAQLRVVEYGAEDSLCTTRPDTLYIGLTNKGFVNAGDDTTICIGESANLRARGGIKHEWMPGNILNTTIQVFPIKDTSYIVNLLDACKDSDTVSVFVKPKPVDMIKDQMQKFCSDDLDPLPLRAKPGYTSYLWKPTEATDSVISVNKSTIVFATIDYTVTVKDQFGCEGTDKITLKSECPPFCVIPQAFSPNDDNINEVLTIYGQHFKDFEMRVFNRWGEVIYLTRDRYKPWDGKYQGEPMEVGTYPWTASYKSMIEGDNKVRFMKGSVTLIR